MAQLGTDWFCEKRKAKIQSKMFEKILFHIFGLFSLLESLHTRLYHQLLTALYIPLPTIYSLLQ